MKKLHDKYVLLPADKASNNVVVICNEHYIEVIMKELNNIMGSKSTYQYVTDNPTNIINRHIKYMKEINVAVPSKIWRNCLVYRLVA